MAKQQTMTATSDAVETIIDTSLDDLGIDVVVGKRIRGRDAGWEVQVASADRQAVGTGPELIDAIASALVAYRKAED